LLARYESAVTDPELRSLRDDVALLQASIQDKLAELAVEQAGPDWKTVVQQIEVMLVRHHKTWLWSTGEPLRMVLAMGSYPPSPVGTSLS